MYIAGARDYKRRVVESGIRISGTSKKIDERQSILVPSRLGIFSNYKP